MFPLLLEVNKETNDKKRELMQMSAVERFEIDE